MMKDFFFKAKSPASKLFLSECYFSLAFSYTELKTVTRENALTSLREHEI